jgi:hypothetical protein
LLGVGRDELKQLEGQNKDVQIVDDIASGYFTGPGNSHKKIKDELQKLATVSLPKQFTIEDGRFGPVTEVEEKRLVEIGVTYKCFVKIQQELTEKMYPIPIASVDKDATVLTPAAMSIDIRIGDLGTQSVDMVVVCPTSQNLLDNILEQAGTTVKDDYKKGLQNGRVPQDGYETAGGQLLCQRLFFLPWTTRKLDLVALRQTIYTFVTTAILHAVKTKQTSLAFPAIGCGQLGYDPNVIAEVILDETQKYANYDLKILIVLLPNTADAYQAFCTKLAELKQKTTVTKLTTFSYPHTSKYCIVINAFDFKFRFVFL